MAKPEVVSAAEWQAVRGKLLVEEKAATRLIDALAAKPHLFVNNILDLNVYGSQELWEGSPADWPQS